jgi:hypothetical protein
MLHPCLNHEKLLLHLMAVSVTQSASSSITFSFTKRSLNSSFLSLPQKRKRKVFKKSSDTHFLSEFIFIEHKV